MKAVAGDSSRRQSRTPPEMLFQPNSATLPLKLCFFRAEVTRH